MSFFDKFSQWNKLDIKIQRANPTQLNFPTANSKMRKTRLCRYSFVLLING